MFNPLPSHPIEELRRLIDAILLPQPDLEERRCGFVHLYGVAQAAVLLALKRGLDADLSITAGMLHDIYTYHHQDTPEHGRLGAQEARQLLQQVGGYTEAEIELICDAILHHSDKQSVHGPLAELLKDADIFQHYLYNPALAAVWRENDRLANILNEFGLYSQNRS